MKKLLIAVTTGLTFVGTLAAATTDANAKSGKGRATGIVGAATAPKQYNVGAKPSRASKIYIDGHSKYYYVDKKGHK